MPSYVVDVTCVVFNTHRCAGNHHLAGAGVVADDRAAIRIRWTLIRVFEEDAYRVPAGGKIHGFVYFVHAPGAKMFENDFIINLQTAVVCAFNVERHVVGLVDVISRPPK